MFEKETSTQPELPDVFNVNTLYHQDGSVNFEGVQLYISKLADGQSHEKGPLDDVSMATGFHFIEMPALSETSLSDEEKQSDLQKQKANDPLEFAVNAYIRNIISQSLEYPTLTVSEALSNDNDVDFNFKDEAKRFFTAMADDQKSALGFVREAQEFMATPRNDANKLDCIVAIPVAGHQEYANIFNTLEQFAKQDLSSDRYEVVLYLNLPGRDGDSDSELADDLKLTLDEIARFQKQYPDIEVRQIINTYRGDAPPIGTIRADLWGTVAYDMTVRGRDEDIMVISADADIINLNSRYLSSMVETFSSSDADMVTAHLRWQPVPGLSHDATANRVLRYQAFLDSTRDRNSDTLFTADANTGISLAAYLAAGGYDRQAQLGEMRGIVSKILYYRQSREDRETEGYSPPKRVVQKKAENAILRTHSRRLIKAMALGRSPYSAWDQDLITFGSDDTLRTESMQAYAAEEAARENWKKWLKEMTGEYMGDMPTIKKRRILKAARRVLNFSDLYK